MIDQWSDDRTGWARFSDDMRMRFRLARDLAGAPLIVADGKVYGIARVVFLMLNPSTADAFRPDPTITRCRGFALAIGADTFEVVNINALRSTDPQELYRRAAGMRGDDADNDHEILMACTGAYRVIAGWGVHGDLGGRGAAVQALLASRGIVLHHLGLTKDGHPRHPLYLKSGTAPQEWIAR